MNLSLKIFSSASAIAFVLLGSSGMMAIAEQSFPVLAQTMEDRKAEADRLFQQGIQQYDTDRFQEALRSWESALELYRKIGDRVGERRIIGSLGNAYRSLREYPQAIDYYQQSLTLFRESGHRFGEGQSLANLGRVYESLRESTQAIDYYQQSLTIFREIDDRPREGSNLYNIGRLYHSLEEYSQALDYYQQSLTIFREIDDRLREGSNLYNLGSLYHSLEEYSQALDYYQQSLTIFRDIGDLVREGRILGNVGNAYRSLREYPQAIDYHQQSLTTFREIGDRSGEGHTLRNLGRTYELFGDYTQAIDYYQQSLTTVREIGDRSGEGHTLRNLGRAYESLGDYTQAIDYYQQSLAIQREVGHRQREGDALGNLGYVYWSLGEYAKAIDYHQQSLAISREIGDRGREGVSLGNLGIVYWSLGDPTKAIEHHQQSLTIDREMGDRAGESVTLNNLGLVYRFLGEYNKAIDYYEQSLVIKKELNDRAGQGSSLGNLGSVYRFLGQYTKAIDYYEQTLAIQQELSDRSGIGKSFHGLGRIYQLLEDYTKAIDYLEQSLAIARELGQRGEEEDTLYELASTQHRQGNSNEALKNIETAINLAESIRADLNNPDLRQSFFAKVSNRYQLYIEILMQLHRENPDRGYDKQAFVASEKNRARTLTELLAEANLNIRQNVDPQLLQEEQRLTQQLSAIEKRRLELTSGSYENSELERLIRDRDVLLQTISDLETRIRRDSPAYADLKYPQPLTLKEIQEQVLDEETLLLEYTLGEERSYLFVVGKNEFSTYELPSREEIEATTEKYAIALQAEDRNPLVEGKELTQMLLSPVADKLKGQRLAIVADGKLHRLPFGALPWDIPPAPLEKEGVRRTGGSIAPLLANHEIVNLSSASSLAIQRQQLANRSPADKKVAVFADPVFSKRDPRLSGEVATNPDNSLLELFRAGCQSFNRLPYTRTEAENILALVPDRQKFLALGFDADRAAATGENLAQYEILHLSTHGCIQDNPQLSGLALSLYDENGTQQDGFLRLQDIYNLQLNADLVVLSACQTGIGEEVSGEGVVGLTRGFMYAGARRVTVSLWNVSDRATADLMSDYYQNMLSEGIQPAAALREAQLQMWRAGELPYKWAAFIMQGDWQ